LEDDAIDKIQLMKNFMLEIDCMKKIGEHENIIQLLGCCTTCTQDEPLYAILEYASKGNIIYFLQSKSPNSSSMELLSYAKQVAQGMEHLHEKKVSHIFKLIISNNLIVIQLN